MKMTKSTMRKHIIEHMVESEVDSKMGLDAEEEYIHGNHDGSLVQKTPRVKTRVSMLETNAENTEITL